VASRIGIISDTHKLLRPEAAAALTGCELIIHAGDIGSLEVIQELEQIAPVRAIRGNVDQAPWADAFPAHDVIEISNRRVYVVHDLSSMSADPAAAGFDVVVSGHSHMPSVREVDGVLFVNPGSAGPRRFTLPITVAVLSITPRRIEAQVHELVA